jgi:hypothetical protein
VKNFNRFYLLTIFIFLSGLSFSQIGGNHAYEFLNLTNSARIGSIGDNFLVSKDNDLNLALADPALITPNMNNNFSLSFVDYFTDINYGYAMYSKTFRTIGSFTGAVQFIDYGKFTYADITGQTSGTFTASEYALNIGWGRELDSSFSIGANLKTILSSLESYHSTGVAVDVAGAYHSKNSNFTASLLFRNIGRQITTYYAGHTEPLPFEIDAGISKRLKYVPFRYFVNYNHIEKWDLTYVDPNNPDNIDPYTGEPKAKSGIADFGDKLMRHFVVGGEISPFKNLSLRLGYNYQRRQELKIQEKAGMVGFSWGVSIRVSKFEISYARATYSLAGAPNYFTFTFNPSTSLKKKQPVSTD